MGGTDVAGIEVDSLCGTRVRGVAVSMKKRSGVGVGVSLGVIVGVGVIVRVFDAVGVGPVAVGNGPYSAFEVRARAVLVPLTLAETPNPRTDGRLNVITKNTPVKNRHKRHPTKT